jgi:ABC-2 type transport system ATP-binding protein
MIHIGNVSRAFGRVQAIRDLSFDVRPGEIFGLAGPDGAGKTTTLRLLCGLLAPDRGRLLVNGLEVGAHLDRIRDQIGYMAQRFGLYGDLTANENLAFYGDLFGVDPAERDRLAGEYLALTRMTEFRRRPAAQLSGGMKQKLALMCVLLHRPRVLLLDEPTNGVDPLSRRDFWRILQNLAAGGMTILVSTAYLDEAERCGRVGLLHRGRLIWTGPPAQLRGEAAPYCFRARASDRHAARAALARAPGVLAAEPAGASVHVYLAPSASAADVERASGVGLDPLDPTLEDAFILLIRREEIHAPA